MGRFSCQLILQAFPKRLPNAFLLRHGRVVFPPGRVTQIFWDHDKLDVVNDSHCVI
jgi:hypothetical protein